MSLRKHIVFTLKNDLKRRLLRNNFLRRADVVVAIENIPEISLTNTAELTVLIRLKILFGFG